MTITIIGQTISHYRIVESAVGRGMGEVYQPHDTTLGRDVAIKVVPEEWGQYRSVLERLP